MATDYVAKKMSQASSTGTAMNPPKKGDKFRCSQCGMQIEVTAPCHCKEGEHVQFYCCGQELVEA
jgi:hypothetical protein